MTRCLASLRRVPADRVPRFHRYYQGTPTSCRPSRRASFLSRGRYHGIAQRFALDRGCARPPSSLGLVARWPRPGFFRGDGRISQVPGEPQCPFAHVLRPRPAETFQTTSETLAWPPLRERRRRRRRESFEAQWHGFRADCLRITKLVALPRARLASGRWSGAAGRAFTRRVPVKGFQLTSCSSSPFPKPLGTIPGISRN